MNLFISIALMKATSEEMVCPSLRAERQLHGELGCIGGRCMLWTMNRSSATPACLLPILMSSCIACDAHNYFEISRKHCKRTFWSYCPTPNDQTPQQLVEPRCVRLENIILHASHPLAGDTTTSINRRMLFFLPECL